MKVKNEIKAMQIMTTGHIGRRIMWRMVEYCIIKETIISGNDLKFEFDNGSITLIDVIDKKVTLKLSDGTITNLEVTLDPYWNIKGTTAIYGTGNDTLITVSGVKTNAPVSGISLNGKVVTLANSVLNEGTVTVSNGYTLKLADDVPKSSTIEANWSISGTTATYKANATSAGYSISSDDRTINYTKASGGNTFTITGLKNGLSVKNGKIEGISIKGNVVVVSSEIVGNGEVKITGEGYALEILKSANIPEGLSVKNNILTVSNKITDETINLKEEWAKGITKVNASAVSQNLNILSNNSNISIKAGKGADTILEPV